MIEQLWSRSRLTCDIGYYLTKGYETRGFLIHESRHNPSPGARVSSLYSAVPKIKI